MKKCLLITYYWPPGSGPGVQRILKFVKYLRSFGWEPVVLTVRNGSYAVTDPSLALEIPQNTSVYRTSTFEPFRIYNLVRGRKGKGTEIGSVTKPKGLFQKLANYTRANLFIPDGRMGWTWYAIPAAKRIIAKEKINLIMTSGPPHSTHLTGQRMKSTFPTIPWIADFRDPWTNIYYNRFLLRTRRSEEMDRKLESSVLQEADAVIVVSSGMKREFEDRNEHITVIPNGYDASDMPEPVDSIRTEVFRLSYIGHWKSNQDIPAFWAAVSEFLGEIDQPDLFRLSFTGTVHKQARESLIAHGLTPYCEFHPFAPHEEATERMVQANCLLLPIPLSKNNRSIVTGKIFEYLASGTPILAIGPCDGDAAAILSTCHREPMKDYIDANGIKEYLLAQYRKWNQAGRVSGKITGTEHGKYERKEQSRRLAAIFDTLMQ